MVLYLFFIMLLVSCEPTGHPAAPYSITQEQVMKLLLRFRPLSLDAYLSRSSAAVNKNERYQILADSGYITINKHAAFGQAATNLTAKGKPYQLKDNAFLIVRAVNYKINKILNIVSMHNTKSTGRTIKITFEMTAKTTPFAILRDINDHIYKESIILTLKDTTWQYSGGGSIP